MTNENNKPKPLKTRNKLCIVSPCFNEEQGVDVFYVELKRSLSSIPALDHEIILIDDGSSDGTLDRLNRLADLDQSVKVLSLSRNFGHQIALTAGMDYADGDALLLLDSDLQHPPDLIPAMVECWRSGGFDVVSAVRRYTAGVSLFKKLTSSAFYVLVNLLSDTKIHAGAADFCLLSRRAHETLASMPERHRFLRGMISWIGFRRAFLPYTAAPRAAGASKYSVPKMLSLALDAAFSFSAAPITLATRLGAAVSIVGLAYLGYVLFRALFFGGLVQGWGSIMSVVLILGGLNFTLIGLIGGYLGRVYEEVKHRPLYVLKQQPIKSEACPLPSPVRELQGPMT